MTVPSDIHENLESHGVQSEMQKVRINRILKICISRWIDAFLLSLVAVIGSFIKSMKNTECGKLNIKKHHLADREYQFISVQSLSRVRLFSTPWIAAHQASLSITNCRSSLRLTSIESVMLSSHLILCRPLLLLPSIPSTIRVFSCESTLRMRWPKYWSFSFSISPSNEHPGLISFRMDWLDVLAV